MILYAWIGLVNWPELWSGSFSLFSVVYAHVRRVQWRVIFFHDVLFRVFCVITFIQKSYYSISSSQMLTVGYLTTNACRIPRTSLHVNPEVDFRMYGAILKIRYDFITPPPIVRLLRNSAGGCKMTCR